MSKSDRPIRIQRKRTKGWKMPLNTVYVGRGSKWGNPFGVGYYYKIQQDVVSLRPRQVRGYRNITPYSACELFKTFRVPKILLEIKTELRGKNLACWCKESEPCHADVLLEIANA